MPGLVDVNGVCSPTVQAAVQARRRARYYGLGKVAPPPLRHAPKTLSVGDCLADQDCESGHCINSYCLDLDKDTFPFPLPKRLQSRGEECDDDRDCRIAGDQCKLTHGGHRECVSSRQGGCSSNQDCGKGYACKKIFSGRHECVPLPAPKPKHAQSLQRRKGKCASDDDCPLRFECTPDNVCSFAGRSLQRRKTHSKRSCTADTDCGLTERCTEDGVCVSKHPRSSSRLSLCAGSWGTAPSNAEVAADRWRYTNTQVITPELLPQGPTWIYHGAPWYSPDDPMYAHLKNGPLTDAYQFPHGTYRN
jgi:hypothetical protein